MKPSSVSLPCRRLAPSRDLGQKYLLPGFPYSRRLGDGSISIPEGTFPAEIWDMTRPAKTARITQETMLGKLFKGEKDANSVFRDSRLLLFFRFGEIIHRQDNALYSSPVPRRSTWALSVTPGDHLSSLPAC